MTNLLYSQDLTHELTGNSTTVSFEFVDNRMFVGPMVDGRKGYFILDTRGYYAMIEEFANSIGLEASFCKLPGTSEI